MTGGSISRAGGASRPALAVDKATRVRVDVLRRIHDARAAGRPDQEIAAELNDTGVGLPYGVHPDGSRAVPFPPLYVGQQGELVIPGAPRWTAGTVAAVAECPEAQPGAWPELPQTTRLTYAGPS